MVGPSIFPRTDPAPRPPAFPPNAPSSARRRPMTSDTLETHTHTHNPQSKGRTHGTKERGPDKNDIRSWVTGKRHFPARFHPRYLFEFFIVAFRHVRCRFVARFPIRERTVCLSPGTPSRTQNDRNDGPRPFIFLGTTLPRTLFRFPPRSRATPARGQSVDGSAARRGHLTGEAIATAGPEVALCVTVVNTVFMSSFIVSVTSGQIA